MQSNLKREQFVKGVPKITTFFKTVRTTESSNNDTDVEEEERSEDEFEEEDTSSREPISIDDALALLYKKPHVTRNAHFEKELPAHQNSS